MSTYDEQYGPQVYEKPVNLHMGHSHTEEFGPARKCTNNSCYIYITIKEKCDVCMTKTERC